MSDTNRRVAPPVFRPRLSLPQRVWREVALQLHVWWLVAGLTAKDALSALSRGRSAFHAWEDEHLFPRIAAYTTNHDHITLMLFLWVALLVCGSFTSVELVGGNYTNGLSGLMTCILLLNQTQHHRENREHHAEVTALHEQHAAEIAALHAKLDSKGKRP